MLAIVDKYDGVFWYLESILSRRFVLLVVVLLHHVVFAGALVHLRMF